MANARVFTGLNDTVIQQILGAAKVRHIAPKKDVTIRGGRPEHLFLLQVGRARSYMLTMSGSEVLLSWKVPGDIVGLASLLPNPPAYMVNATTVSECKFLVWDHDTIRRLARVYPQLSENGFRLALHYLRMHIDRHVNILTKSAETRLAEVLHRLASQVGTCSHRDGESTSPTKILVPLPTSAPSRQVGSFPSGNGMVPSPNSAVESPCTFLSPSSNLFILDNHKTGESPIP